MMPTRLSHKSSDVLTVLSAYFCDPPDGLSEEDLATLHVFKHEVLAAGFRVYEKISVKTASPLIAKIFKEVGDQIEQPGPPV